MIDVCLILKSTQTSTGLSRIGWRPHLSEVGTRLQKALPRWTGLPKVEPLTAEQESAVHEAVPKILAFSKECSEKLSRAYHDPDVTQIFNCDWELDDERRMTPFAKWLREIRELKKRNTDTMLPKTILMAGMRNGVASNTFEASRKWLDLHLGSMGETDPEDEGAVRWSDCNLTLLDGGDLRQTSKEDWVAGKTTAPSALTLKAAQRLEKEVGKDPFNYHGCTSAVLWDNLSPEFKKQCIIPAMTNASYIGRDGKLHASANGNFDLSSLYNLAQSDVPTVHSHGSFFQYDAQTFKDMKAWGQVLKTKVVDPTFYRRQIEESMRLGTKWMQQMEAELLGKREKSYLPVVEQRVIEVLDEQEAEMSWLSDETRSKDTTTLSDSERKAVGAKHFWLQDALKAGSYAAKKTKQTWDLRLQGLVSKVLNPLDNSLADYLMSHIDRPDPPDCIYLPCRIDLEGIARLRNDVDTIEVDFEDHNVILPILGDEDQLEKQFAQDIADAQKHITDHATASVLELHDVVDESLARQLSKWYALHKKTAQTVVAHLDQEGDTMGKPENELNELQESMTRMISLSDEGPMALHVKSVLDPTDVGSEGDLDRFEQLLENSSHQSVLLKCYADLLSNAASTEL